MIFRKRFGEFIFVGFVETQRGHFRVFRVFHVLKLFVSEMEPAHDKQADGESVGEDYYTFWVVWLLEIPVESFKEEGATTVDVGSGFTVRDAVVKYSIGVTFFFDTGGLVLGAEVAVFLFAYLLVFVFAIKRAWRECQTAEKLVAGLARSGKRRQVYSDGRGEAPWHFAAKNARLHGFAEVFAGFKGLFASQWGEWYLVVGNGGIEGTVGIGL